MDSSLLTLNEGKTLEFKRDLSSPKNLLKTLVAFANTAGGKELFAASSPKAQVEVQVEAQVDLDILAICLSQPSSSKEIATALGHKQLSGNLRKALPRLKNAGFLEYTIPDKPNSRLQKYRLTAKGSALLDSYKK